MDDPTELGVALLDIQKFAHKIGHTRGAGKQYTSVLEDITNVFHSWLLHPQDRVWSLLDELDKIKKHYI